MVNIPEERKTEIIAEIKKAMTDPDEFMGENKKLFRIGNTFRRVRGLNKKVYTVLDDVYFDLLHIIFEKGWKMSFPDNYNQLLAMKVMDKCQVGSPKKYETKTGEKYTKYNWQGKHAEEQMRLIKNTWDFFYERKKQNGYSSNVGKIKPQQKALPANHPLYHPYIIPLIYNELGRKLVGEEANRLIIFLSTASAYLIKKPIGISIVSPSSTGKSFTLGQILKHFHFMEEDFKNVEKWGNKPAIFRLTDMTDAFLYRVKSEIWNRKILWVGEKEDKETEIAAQLNRFTRQLQSEGWISKGLVSDTPNEFGEREPTMYNIKADISSIMENAKGIEEQQSNRTLNLSLDESPEQTKAIQRFRSERDMYPDNKEIQERENPSKVLLEIVNNVVINQFQEIDYQNPFAQDVSNILFKCYSGYEHLRRITDYVLSLIEVITRLPAKQHGAVMDAKVKTGMKLVATGEDNLVILALLWGSISQSITKAIKGDLQLLGAIKDAIKDDKIELLPKSYIDTNGVKRIIEGDWFTVPKLAKGLEKDKKRIYKAFKNLTNAGWLKKEKFRNDWTKYCINEKENEKEDKSSDSIGSADILPFINLMGYQITPRLLSSQKVQKSVRQQIYLNMSTINFLRSKLPLNDIINNIYIYIEIRRNFSKLSDLTNEDISKILQSKCGYMEMLESGDEAEWTEVYLSDGTTEGELSDQPIESDDLGSSKNNSKKINAKMITNAIILLETGKGVTKTAILRELTKNPNLTAEDKEAIKEQMNFLLEIMQNEGEISEPFPDKYKNTS